jgi:transcriptional regulator with XRE-family HTH domain
MSTLQISSLGEFIRTRRDRLSPEQVGLQAGPRRRAKGLRREELAALCGISPTWLTWIEQGRAISVSATAISRMARALLLSRAERDYLFELAGVRDPERLDSPPHVDFGNTLAELVSKIQTPAYVLDRAWNAVAWNPEAADLFVGWLDKKLHNPTLLQYVFLSSQARTLIADWPVRAQRLVAEFRGDCRTALDTPEMRSQIENLCKQSPEFAGFWSQHDVMEREGGERLFYHPTRGKVFLRQLTLRLTHSPDLKLVTLL